MDRLDPAGLRRLRQLAEAEGSDLFQAVGPCEGTDSEKRLSLTLDAARRVTGVVVNDMDGLRNPEAVATAVREAYAMADGERAYRSLQLSGAVDAWLARADDTVAGRTARPMAQVPDVSQRASKERRQAGLTPPQRSGADRATGRSENGYLSITRGTDGRILDVDVDVEWLQAAQPKRLSAAISQAATSNEGG